ncbi:hypothetical protein OC835_004513 [Tilletia horrida]|nr:hypothetical protein OC835_004513 [Tilletia horrida]
MDIYAKYHLPPPPPPTIFSRDHGPSRARMPNFTSVEEVSAFIANSIVWRHSKQSDTFLIFCIVYVATIEVMLSLFVLRKIYQRAWWLFRISPRGHKMYIVPNVHTSWALFIGIYGWVLTGSFIASHIKYVRNQPVPYNGLWITLLWAGIPFAAWYQTYGIIAARVEQTFSSDKDVLSSLPAWLVNIVAICLPGVPGLVAAIPGIFSNVHFERARHGWYDWHAKYDGMTELNRDLLVDAQNIFHDSIRGCYYISAMMLIWAATVIILGAAYACTACALIKRLRSSVRHHGKPPKAHSAATPLSPASSSKMQSGTDIRSATADVIYDAQQLTAIKWAVPGATFEPASPRAALRKQTIREVIDEQIHSQLFSRSQVQNDRAMSYFPSVRPSQTIHSVKTSTAKKVLLYFEIQAVASLLAIGHVVPACVLLGAIGFLVTTLYMSTHFAPASERNEAEKVEITCYIMVCVISVVAGTGSSISMTHASFEASFSSLLSSHRSDRKSSSPSWSEDAA